MRDLRNYLINAFNDPGISMNQLLAGTTDHLGRLTARNGGGEWTARIGVTSTALQAVQSALGDDLSKAASREARVLAKNEFRKVNVVGDLNKILAALVMSYGKGSAEVRGVFNDGLTTFRRATDDGLGALLDQMVTNLTPLAATVGPTVMTLATNLRAAWETIYAASEDAAAEKTMTQEEKNAARATLQRELYITLMHVGIKHPDEPEAITSYFMMHLFGGPALSGGGGGGGGSPDSSFPDSSSSFPDSSSSFPRSSYPSSSYPSSSFPSSSFPSSSYPSSSYPTSSWSYSYPSSSSSSSGP